MATTGRGGARGRAARLRILRRRLRDAVGLFEVAAERDRRAHQTEEVDGHHREAHLFRRAIETGQHLPAGRNAAMSSNDPFVPSRMSTKFSFESGIPRLLRTSRSI